MYTTSRWIEGWGCVHYLINGNDEIQSQSCCFRVAQLLLPFQIDISTTCDLSSLSISQTATRSSKVACMSFVSSPKILVSTLKQSSPSFRPSSLSWLKDTFLQILFCGAGLLPEASFSNCRLTLNRPNLLPLLLTWWPRCAWWLNPWSIKTISSTSNTCQM